MDANNVSLVTEEAISHFNDPNSANENIKNRFLTSRPTSRDLLPLLAVYGAKTVPIILTPSQKEDTFDVTGSINPSTVPTKQKWTIFHPPFYMDNWTHDA